MGDTVSSLLFQPPPPSKLKEEKIVWIKNKYDKRIPAFFIEYRKVKGTETVQSLSLEELRNTKVDGITLLYSHANAEDLGSIYPWCKFLCKMLKVNLLAYDYVGYGMAYEEGSLVWWNVLIFPSTIPSNEQVFLFYRRSVGRALLCGH
jgi:hypothetical protein